MIKFDYSLRIVRSSHKLKDFVQRVKRLNLARWVAEQITKFDIDDFWAKGKREIKKAHYSLQ